jgi:hypothetical protein
MMVATSLARRDGMDLGQGIALWEHYNRAALRNLEGTETMVCRYESLLDDPRSFVSTLVAWLGSLDQFHRKTEWDVPRSLSSLRSDERHAAEDEASMLLPEQRELEETLTKSEGGHRSLPPTTLGAESPWTTSVIRAHRDVRSREVDLLRQTLGGELESRRIDIAKLQRTLDVMTESTSWRLTRPLRSAADLLHRRAGRSPAPAVTEDDGH